jgi:protein translocase SecG subunit
MRGGYCKKIAFSVIIFHMNSILLWIQIILAIIIILGILAQKSNAGLGGAFGAGNDGATTYHTKRGFEKFLFFSNHYFICGFCGSHSRTGCCALIFRTTSEYIIFYKIMSQSHT